MWAGCSIAPCRRRPTWSSASAERPHQAGWGPAVRAVFAGPLRGSPVGDPRVLSATTVLAVTRVHADRLAAEAGIISENEPRFPHKNVTREHGSREYVRSTRDFSRRAGRRVHVCSYGLHGYVHDDEIAGMVALGPEARDGSSKREQAAPRKHTTIVVTVSLRHALRRHALCGPRCGAVALADALRSCPAERTSGAASARFVPVERLLKLSWCSRTGCRRDHFIIEK